MYTYIKNTTCVYVEYVHMYTTYVYASTYVLICLYATYVDICGYMWMYLNWIGTALGDAERNKDQRSINSKGLGTYSHLLRNTRWNLKWRRSPARDSSDSASLCCVFFYVCFVLFYIVLYKKRVWLFVLYCIIQKESLNVWYCSVKNHVCTHTI